MVLVHDGPRDRGAMEHVGRRAGVRRRGAVLGRRAMRGAGRGRRHDLAAKVAMVMGVVVAIRGGRRRRVHDLGVEKVAAGPVVLVRSVRVAGSRVRFVGARVLLIDVVRMGLLVVVVGLVLLLLVMVRRRWSAGSGSIVGVDGLGERREMVVLIGIHRVTRMAALVRIAVDTKIAPRLVGRAASGCSCCAEKERGREKLKQTSKQGEDEGEYYGAIRRGKVRTHHCCHTKSSRRLTRRASSAAEAAVAQWGQTCHCPRGGCWGPGEATWRDRPASP